MPKITALPRSRSAMAEHLICWQATRPPVSQSTSSCAGQPSDEAEIRPCAVQQVAEAPDQLTRKCEVAFMPPRTIATE